LIDKCTSEVDFDGLLNTAVGAGSAAMQDDEEVESNGDLDDDLDDDESDDGQPLPSASATASASTSASASALASAATSSVIAAKLKYRELLAKARKYPGGEAP